MASGMFLSYLLNFCYYDSIRDSTVHYRSSFPLYLTDAFRRAYDSGGGSQCYVVADPLPRISEQSLSSNPGPHTMENMWSNTNGVSSEWRRYCADPAI